MNRILRLLVASALTLTFMGSRQPASAQKSPAFGAKFKIAEGADLRILDDNIWDYSQDTIPPKWKEIGEDPRDFRRAPQFARLVKDYMPDVFAFQEYSEHMHNEFYPLVEKKGYVIAWESKEDWNNTPIFYNKRTLEPIYVYYNMVPSHLLRPCSGERLTARCSRSSARICGGKVTRLSPAARWRGLRSCVL